MSALYRVIMVAQLRAIYISSALSSVMPPPLRYMARVCNNCNWLMMMTMMKKEEKKEDDGDG